MHHHLINSKAIIYNPYPEMGGGGEIQKNLFEIICKSLPKFDVELLSSANNLSGIKLYFSRFVYVLKNRQKIYNSDLIFVQSIFDPGSILIGYYARKYNIKYFVIPRGDYVPNKKNVFKTKSYYIKRFIWFLFGKKLVNNSISLIVTSVFEKNRLVDVASREDHIEIIPDPTFDKIQDQIKVSIESKFKFIKDNDVPYALWLGRFSKEKGLDLIIDAWKDVHNVVPQAKLLLIGTISHQEEFDLINKKIKNLNLATSILIFNWVSGNDKNYLLNNARCLLLPSLYESFGIVVSESLSFRTPVIVSDGTPWTGISPLAGLCIPRDTKIWSEAISSYVNSENKIVVPDEIIIKTLNPFSKVEIFKLWEKVFFKYKINFN
jgi:glycosyltransferase involved in cell wall biosynthesis